MDLKKVALSVMLITSLAGIQAGCSDDGDGTGGGSGGGAGGGSGTGGGAGGGTGGSAWVDPEAGCPGTAGTGDQTFELTSIVIPNAEVSEPADIPGFNLDNAGSGTCDATDFGPSMNIDNALATLVSVLDLAVGIADNPSNASGTVNEEISDAIAGGTLTIGMTVTGWNGTNEDLCVLVDLDTGSGTAVTDVPAAVSGGVLYADLGDFTMDLPLGAATATFTVHNALATVDVDTLEGTVGGILYRGSAETAYTAALGMAAPDGTLFATIYDVVEALAAAMGADPAALHTTVGGALPASTYDINGEATCDGVSMGFTITAVETTP